MVMSISLITVREDIIPDLSTLSPEARGLNFTLIHRVSIKHALRPTIKISPHHAMSCDLVAAGLATTATPVHAAGRDMEITRIAEPERGAMCI
jgi:hypothetical protein